MSRIGVYRQKSHAAQARAEGDRVVDRGPRFNRPHVGAQWSKSERSPTTGASRAIVRTAPPDWRAAAWALEHGPARSRYRRPDPVELSGSDGGAIGIDEGESAREFILAKLATMLSRLGVDPEGANSNGKGAKPPTIGSADT